MRVFFILIIFALISACARTTFDHNFDHVIKNFDHEKTVNVKIISNFKEDFQYSSKKIYVFPNNGNISLKNPWFNYFADYVYAAFAAKGFARAKRPEKAEIAIMLDYYVSHPIKYTRSYTKQTNDGTRDVIAFNKKKNMLDLPIVKERNGIREVFNYHTDTVSTFLYQRRITLEGIDLIKYKEVDGLREESNIFMMKLESTGSSNDLKKILPISIAASQRFIAKTTPKPVWRKLKFSSRDLRDLVAFIQDDNAFLTAERFEGRSFELYYMIPPTSRPRRLRLLEGPEFDSF